MSRVWVLIRERNHDTVRYVRGDQILQVQRYGADPPDPKQPEAAVWVTRQDGDSTRSEELWEFPTLAQASNATLALLHILNSEARGVVTLDEEHHTVVCRPIELTVPGVPASSATMLAEYTEALSGHADALDTFRGAAADHADALSRYRDRH